MSSPEQQSIVGWRRHLPASSRAVLAGQEGLEPPTAGFGDRNSSQLSYCPMPARAGMHGPLVYLHQIQKCTWPEGLPSNCARRLARRPRRSVSFRLGKCGCVIWVSPSATAPLDHTTPLRTSPACKSGTPLSSAATARCAPAADRFALALRSSGQYLATSARPR